MIVHSASQLLTLAGGPQRGSELGRLGIIPDGALLVRGERIAAVGPSAELRAAYPDEPALDAGGKVVLPGFVDPHTAVVEAVFRLFLANGNQPMSAIDLGKRLNRPAETILRTLAGPRVYRGIRPIMAAKHEEPVDAVEASKA